MLIVGEPLHHCFGDHLTYAVTSARRSTPAEAMASRAELTSQRLRGGRTHMSDGQCDDDPPQAGRARRPCSRVDLRVFAELPTTLVFARISSEELAGEKIVCVDQEQITDVRDDATVKQRYGRLVTQPLDIECIARCDVKKAFPELGRASVGIRAAKVLVTFLLRGDRGAAFGALTG